MKVTSHLEQGTATCPPVDCPLFLAPSRHLAYQFVFTIPRHKTDDPLFYSSTHVSNNYFDCGLKIPLGVPAINRVWQVCKVVASVVQIICFQRLV